jgi:hypothetical protein
MSAQIDLLVFYRPLQPIDDDIGAPSSLAVHADRDVPAAYCAIECSAVELAAMVRWLPLIDKSRANCVKSDLILFMPKQAQSFGVLPTT